MKKDNLVEVVAKMGHSKAVATDIVNAIFDTIVEWLEKWEKISISKLGIFDVKDRAARTWVNPKTGEKIQIPARKAVTFKVAKSLKETLKK